MNSQQLCSISTALAKAAPNDKKNKQQQQLSV
jgi:hypothetical protein